MLRKKSKTRVLCVDDEPRVLEGLALQLRRGYEVSGAPSGEAGLALLASDGPFAVVLSDMRMPQMDGASFLAQVRRKAPDTVRMLLTGHADMQAAIAAVNEGQIFRFLTKPCPPEQLRRSFEAATEQYRLVTAERVLLEQTLHGSVKALTEILAMTNPAAFGRATRIKKHVGQIANALGLEDRWQVEVAAMLSQLGLITLPDETAEKLHKGQKLSAEEGAMLARVPSVTAELLANIPRLEGVCELLAKRETRFEVAQRLGSVPRGAAVLKIAVDYVELESQGLSAQLALDSMRGREGWYDPEALQKFTQLEGAAAERQEIREVALRAVSVGMIFAEDVRTTTGVLLVTRGCEVTPSFMERLRNFKQGFVAEPLRVIVSAAAAAKQSQ